MYSPQEIAREHATAEWKRGHWWKCLCPSCRQVRDADPGKLIIREDMGYGGPWLVEPAVEPLDDHTW